MVDGFRVTIPVDPGAAAPWFRQDAFRVEYAGVDGLAELSDAILVVPALGTVLTLSYALGLPIEVGRVDAEYAASAERLAKTFGAMYPHFRTQDFELRGERVGTPAPGPAPADPALLLFSGGADSTSSLIEHRDEVRALLTVWGADVHSSDRALWDRLRLAVQGTALTAGRRLISARANLQDLIDGPALSRHHAHAFASGNWWGAVQHGLSLTSLAVPVAAALGLPRVLIASSDLGGADVPWGSTPSIDNEVLWSGGRVEHDQPDLSRTDKITQVIAPYLRGGGRLDLAVCYQPGRGPGGLNCGRCEKCLLTTTQLLVAGIDPAEVGMPMSPATLATARRALSRGSWRGDDGHRRVWHQLQAGISTTLTGACATPYVRDYLEWLRETEIVIGTFGAEPMTHRMVHNAQYLGSRLLGWLPFPVRNGCSRLAARLLGEG